MFRVFVLVLGFFIFVTLVFFIVTDFMHCFQASPASAASSASNRGSPSGITTAPPNHMNNKNLAGVHHSLLGAAASGDQRNQPAPSPTMARPGVTASASVSPLKKLPASPPNRSSMAPPSLSLQPASCDYTRHQRPLPSQSQVDQKMAHPPSTTASQLAPPPPSSAQASPVKPPTGTPDRAGIFGTLYNDLLSERHNWIPEANLDFFAKVCLPN